MTVNREDDFLLPREARLAETIAGLQYRLNEQTRRYRALVEAVQRLVSDYDSPGSLESYAVSDQLREELEPFLVEHQPRRTDEPRGTGDTP